MKNLPLIWQLLLFVLPIILFILFVIFFKNEWFIKGSNYDTIIYIKRRRSVLKYISTFFVCFLPGINVIVFISYIIEMINEFFKGEDSINKSYSNHKYHPTCLFKNHSQSYKYESLKNFLNKQI